jgi:preprotein translocase subunit SecG
VIQNIVTFLLVLNSFLTIGLILNQNESAKDATSNTSTQITNPLEKVTWLCVFLEFVLFLIKSKLNDL